MIKFLKVNYLFWRNALIRDAKISGVILSNIIMSLFDLVVLVVSAMVIFQNAETIGGLTVYQVIFLTMYAKAIGTLHSMWTKKGTNSFAGEMVRLGDYDFYLTKPMNSMLLVSISKPRTFDIVKFLVEVAIMIFAISASGQNISFQSFLTFLYVSLCAFLLWYFIRILTIVPAFWIKRNNELATIMDRANTIMRYPAGIFPGLMVLALSSIFPILLITYLPVKVLLLDFNYTHIIYITIITITFGLLASYFWKKGERVYGSASS